MTTKFELPESPDRAEAAPKAKRRMTERLRARRGQGMSNDDVLAAMRRVAAGLNGARLTYERFEREGVICGGMVRNRFGGIREFGGTSYLSGNSANVRGKPVDCEKRSSGHNATYPAAGTPLNKRCQTPFFRRRWGA